MNDTFTLWAHQDKASGEITWVASGIDVRKAWASAAANPGERVVKLECRIVKPQRKPKRGTYPNDNFGLPAEYKPHNPDNLTREQVGEGFRLPADVEIWERTEPSRIIRAWTRANWGRCDYTGALAILTYRVPINTPLDINLELKTK